MQTCHSCPSVSSICSPEATPQPLSGPTGSSFTRKLLRALATRKHAAPSCKRRHRLPKERCRSGCFAFAAKHKGNQDPFRGDRRNSILRFVQEVQPSVVEQFAEHTPAQVVEAIRQTVTNITGMLPPQFFSVKISSKNDDLAQLMYTAMMTGYMFRNAQYRLELRTSITSSLLEGMDEAALLDNPSDVDDNDERRSTSTALQEIFQTASGYAPGSQKHKAQGTVLRWHNEYGKEEVPVQQYIESLEHEVSLLRRELQNTTYLKMSQNQLLDYMRCLEQQSLNELTASQDEDTAEAMNSFVHRLLGSGDSSPEMGECTSQELSHLLVWLLVVGYQLRVLEVRLDLEATMLVGSMDE